MEESIRRWNDSGATPLTLRSHTEIAGFFRGLELVDPGIVMLPQWRAEPHTPYTDRYMDFVGAVGRKP